VRIIGLDIGQRRIGVAISDVTQTLARPVGVIPSTGDPHTAVHRITEEVRRFAAEEDGVAGIVIGLPRRLDGSANEMTPRVTALADALRARVDMPIVLQDERLSSREAESRLAVREKDWRARKPRVDAAAAAVILQDYLDNLHA
jgi:putative Holliday junction resolvase